ncbi:hypothetical protein ACVNS2_08335 [Paenibacillus caseinilyticus]|nr:hypothetical protein [Paenibacillus mucilaginosus]
MKQPGPFEDPGNVVVITIDRIMKRESPILYVTHDEDDGMWQFLDGGETKEEEARLLSLKEMVNIDPSLIQLSDLPLGWIMERQSI